MTDSIVIVGCGAATHRYYLPALKKIIDSINELYFADKNLAQAEMTVKELGCGKAVDDYRRIIGKVRGAIIVVPNHLHFSVAMDFLRAGVSVLCEKPLAENPDEVKQMVETAEANRAILCVNNTRRMFPSFVESKKLIENGRIGKLLSIDYREGGVFGWQSLTGFYVDPSLSSKGILVDLGSHVIDTICWLLSTKPKLIEYLDDSYGGPESVTSIKAKADGCRITILLNRLCELDSSFRITGELGIIEGRPMDWGQLTLKNEKGRMESRHLPTRVKKYPEFVIPVVENFIKVLNHSAEPLISGANVLDSIEFIDECYRNRKRFSMPWYDGLKNLNTELKSHVTLVTGAAGFIGSRIVETMYLTGCRRVKAGIHTWSSATRLGRFPVELVSMDLTNPHEIKKALEGVTEIVHCAKGPGEVTVEGTRNLLEAACKNGIRRFVHLSTTEVYGNVAGVVFEEAPFQYTGNAYNLAKIDAEKACWKYYEKGLPLVVLRPSIVYGPFSKNWTLHFARLLIDRKWGILKKIGDGKANLIYVDDLVEAVWCALENEASIGEAFNIVGFEVGTWNEYFKKFNAILDLPPLKTVATIRANIKTTALQPIRLLGRFVRGHFMEPVKMITERFEKTDRLLRKMESILKETPAPDELKLFSKNAVYSSKKAADILDFRPRYSLEKGLSKTKKWLEHQGFF